MYFSYYHRSEMKNQSNSEKNLKPNQAFEEKTQIWELISVQQTLNLRDIIIVKILLSNCVGDGLKS